MEYMSAMKKRSAIVREWQLFLEEYPILVTPFCLSLPYKVNEDLKGDERVKDILIDMQPSYAFNFLSLPAAIAPMGIHEDVPYAVQIVGQKFREDMILDAAQVIQQQVGILPEKLWAREDK